MMLSMEEILCELNREEMNEQGLPPGFRFYPTDEELITFYLASKVYNGTFCGVQIAEVDLNRCEPWELPEVAKMGEREWYFFSLRDRKYPTGLRTNRATGAGYWKATGKDREVYAGTNGVLIGMKKTLVFYKGRAPRGEKTKWVMHEYRLDGHFSFRYSSKEEWVICRIHHKIGEKKNATYEGYPTLKTAAMNAPLTPSPKTPWQQAESLHHHENDLIKSLFNNNLSQTTLTNTLFPSNNVTATSTAFSSTKRYKDDKQDNHVDTNNITCPTSRKNETQGCTFSSPLYYYNGFGMNAADNSSSSLPGMEEGMPCNYFNNVVMDNCPIKIAAQSWPLHP